MALTPNDSKHALQIIAGTSGRKRGHAFEAEIADLLNKDPLGGVESNSHVFTGSPQTILVNTSLNILGWNEYDDIDAIALGQLATAEEGKKWLDIQGVRVKASKSDILINIHKNDKVRSVGISVKKCNNTNPTNAQLYFTTARAFCDLLRRNEINVPQDAENALRQFCGDDGFRPSDNDTVMRNRITDHRRYFWEEINSNGRRELENIFTNYQDRITELLLRKAYLDDPFAPEILLHKTKLIANGDQEYAVYTINDLIRLSSIYAGFNKKKYSVGKGSHKDPIGVKHDAPSFGIVQMQRGGQKQHPTQLQFNLQAGYFYKI